MGVSVGYKNKTVERGSLLSGDEKREEGSYERNGGISGQNNFAIIKISSVEVLFLLFIWMERGQTCETTTITLLRGCRVGSVSFQPGFTTGLSKIQESNFICFAHSGCIARVLFSV